MRNKFKIGSVVIHEGHTRHWGKVMDICRVEACSADTVTLSCHKWTGFMEVPHNEVSRYSY